MKSDKPDVTRWVAAAFSVVFVALIFTVFARADEAQSARIAAISYAQVRMHFPEPLVVEPVVFAGDYALADWNSGGKTGEVLLLLGPTGKWHVVALENSSLSDAKFLEVRYHLPDAVAAALVEEIIAAEKHEGIRP